MEDIICSYDDHVKEALDDVKGGQHLRFINDFFRTKEVCLKAVRFESTHTLALTDFYSVPMGNLDYVTNHMREIMKDNTEYLRRLDKAYLEKKELEKQNGYYGDFKTHQEKLNHYEADNHDDMLRKMYNILVKKD
jgi:hypothetical protein